MTTGPGTSPGPTLPPLPTQPAGVRWPTESWPETVEPALPARARSLCDFLFDLPPGCGVTYALLIVRGGRITFERYAHGASALYMQYSWSMAKSVTHALTGILVRQDRLDIGTPAAVPEWQEEDDPRKAITLDHLLRMRSGLEFNEDYVDGEVSDVIPMLMGEGREDTGLFAAQKPLIHKPGTEFSYSSGTTNIVCRVLRDVVGGGASGMLEFMHEGLFEPLGMRTATPRFDRAGTFIGSSFLFASPQDFARFGLLYLRNGIWEDHRILPEGWVDYARTCSYRDAEQAYGAHWWLSPEHLDRFSANGYDGQRILLVPAKDLLIVRLGRTDADHIEPVRQALDSLADLL